MNLFQERSGHRLVLKSLAHAQIIRPLPDDDLILCPSCDQEKPPSEYFFRNNPNDPRFGMQVRLICRKCSAQQRRKA